MLAGESLALPFTLSAQPVEAVSVTLTCGELLEPLGSWTITVTPLQWRRGATFRLKAKDDDSKNSALMGTAMLYRPLSALPCTATVICALKRYFSDTSKPSTLESCEITAESGDGRFTFSKETLADGGIEVDNMEILIYKQYCSDGSFRAHCPCLPGQQCRLSRSAHCPAGTYRHVLQNISLGGWTVCTSFYFAAASE